MGLQSITIRAEIADIAQWKRKATQDGRNLSGWMRWQLNRAAVAVRPDLGFDVEPRREQLPKSNLVESMPAVRIEERVDLEAPARRDRFRVSAPVDGESKRGGSKRKVERICEEPVGAGIYCPACGRRH